MEEVGQLDEYVKRGAPSWINTNSNFLYNTFHLLLWHYFIIFWFIFTSARESRTPGEARSQARWSARHQPKRKCRTLILSTGRCFTARHSWTSQSIYQRARGRCSPRSWTSPRWHPRHQDRWRRIGGGVWPRCCNRAWVQLISKSQKPQRRRSHRWKCQHHLQRSHCQPGKKGPNPVQHYWADYRARPESQQPLCQLKLRAQPRTQGPHTSGSSQSTKQPRLRVQPSACLLSNARLHPQPQALPAANITLNRSAIAALPNAIDADPIEYMLDAFDSSSLTCWQCQLPCKLSFAFASTAKCSLILQSKNSSRGQLAVSMTSWVVAPAALRVWALRRPPWIYLRTVRIDSLTFIFIFNNCPYQQV